MWNDGNTGDKSFAFSQQVRVEALGRERGKVQVAGGGDGRRCEVVAGEAGTSNLLENPSWSQV